MKIIELDTEQYNRLQFARREFLTDKKDAEVKMKEWYRYMNYPKDTKVYKFVRTNGIKWIVEEV